MPCSETERNEFSEAKDRLKHSWAADRDDFARVKDALKKKNADHHVQNGRLSQALKVSDSPSPRAPTHMTRSARTSRHACAQYLRYSAVSDSNLHVHVCATCA